MRQKFVMIRLKKKGKKAKGQKDKRKEENDVPYRVILPTNVAGNGRPQPVGNRIKANAVRMHSSYVSSVIAIQSLLSSMLFKQQSQSVGVLCQSAI